MLFSGSNQMLNPAPVAATRANIERAIATIDQRRRRQHRDRAGAQAHRRAAQAGDVSRSVIVVTDGYVTVENEVFQLVRKNLGNSNVFAFGIGTSVNRHLIEGIARAGQGEPFVVTKPEVGCGAGRAPAQDDRRARAHAAEGALRRPGGVRRRTATLNALPDVLGGRPVLLYGKWRGEPRGQLVLEGQAATGTHTDVVPVRAPDADASALRHL
jgi:Ca-activated chloride channel family protein